MAEHRASDPLAPHRAEAGAVLRERQLFPVWALAVTATSVRLGRRGVVDLADLMEERFVKELVAYFRRSYPGKPFARVAPPPPRPPETGLY